MRALTNDYRDCKIIKIDPADPTSPYGVMQEGYDPNDPTYRTRMFYLQRDGQWIDEIARSARPDSEGGDVLFETSAEALELLGRLRGKPVVRDLPVSQDEMKNYLARVGSGSPAGTAAPISRPLSRRQRQTLTHRETSARSAYAGKLFRTILQACAGTD